jgi:uncharacterized damage-inducible protein DinB
MKRIAWFACLALPLLLIVAGSASVHAQEKGKQELGGFRGEFLWQLDDGAKKLVSLAEAIPAEKYSWRPGEGVRSTSELFMHVAGANFWLPSLMGVPVPEGIDRGMEKTVTQKAEVMDHLQKSIQHLRNAVLNTADADLEKSMTIFDRESTVQGVLLLCLTHTWEHLGQAIAYARMNDVVPPWTAEREAQKKAKK